MRPKNQLKKARVPAKVVERALGLAQPRPAAKPASDKKAKVVAALKRLHPMD